MRYVGSHVEWLLESEETRLKFSLAKVYSNFWVKLELYGSFHERMCGQCSAHPTSHEWVGLFRNSKDALSKWVVSGGYLKDSIYGPVQFMGEFIGTFPKPNVGLQQLTLMEVNLDARDATPPMDFPG